MENQELLRKLKELKEKYTWSFDKLAINAEIRQVKEAIVRDDMMRYKPIKDLVKAMRNMIDDITFALGKDRTLTEEERAKLFERRDAFEWLISFFGEAQETLKGAKKKVEKEFKK